MKKMLKKVISVILSIAISSSLATSVMAADISPRNTLLNSYTCAISDKNNDTAKINVTARAITSVTQIDVSIEVQVKGLFGYSEDQTISDTFYGYDGSYQDTISINSSKSYRLVVTYTAYSPSTSETVTKTSAAT